MATFAELDLNNVVIQVVVIDNSVLKNSQGQDVEQLGIDFLQNLYGTDTVWKQTSYNTKYGMHYDPSTNVYTENQSKSFEEKYGSIKYVDNLTQDVFSDAIPSADQSKAFRKNYAGIGYTYDQTRDAFINPKPIVEPNMEQYVSFDEFACIWRYNPPLEN